MAITFKNLTMLHVNLTIWHKGLKEYNKMLEQLALACKSYGIKNCDTMKKSLKWLDDNNIAYDFHDYKKIGVDMDFLKKAMDMHGWETIINRKGMTWRQMPEKDRESMSREQAELLADAKPSVIKRPLLDNGETIIVGFDPDVYKETLL